MSGDVDAGWATRILLVVGFVATVALTVLVTRRATRTLQTRLGSETENVAARSEGTE